VRSRAALTVLGLLSLAVPLSHLQLQQVDQRWLLDVDGRLVDVAGQWSDRMNHMLRDCTQVHVVPPNEAMHAQALKTLQQHSPPDSLELRLSRLWQMGDWLLAEVDFERLAPAVVLLRHHETALEVVTSGVWSGSTHPHWPAPFIRQYLARRVLEAPAALLNCFDPVLPLFRFGRSHQ